MSEPTILVDDSLLTGAVNVLPMHWLEGARVVAYTSGSLADAPLHEADGLLLRSVTRVGPEEIARAGKLAGVATLSSGTDHVDEDALDARGIGFFTGRGGNAIAVADWVHWSLWCASGRGSREGFLQGKTALVVGCGAVGTLVDERLRQLGATTILCDPPRARRDSGFASMEIDAALAIAPEIITLHTPLVRAGADATLHLLDADRLQRCRDAIVINAARGDVLDATSAAELRRQGHLAGLYLDTFPNEPNVDAALVQACDAATPHVGGHSIEGKLRVAAWPLAALRKHLGLPPVIELQAAIDSAIADRPADRTEDPFASLDETDAEFRADPGPFRRHRGGQFRTERVLYIQ